MAFSDVNKAQLFPALRKMLEREGQLQICFSEFQCTFLNPHKFEDKPRRAYLSTFTRVWPFIWKLVSGSESALGWKVESGSALGCRDFDFFTFWGIITHPWHPKGPRIWKLAKKISTSSRPAEIFGKTGKCDCLVWFQSLIFGTPFARSSPFF